MRNKADPSCVAAATEWLDRLIPTVDPDLGTSTLASVDARSSANIYNFETLQSIANGVNFQEVNRRSRYGTKQILRHGRNLPNENLRYQIFDLANRVTEYSNLPSNLRT